MDIRPRIARNLLAATALFAIAAAPAPPEAARVTITRDTWGIAHVVGKTDADAVFGAIYAQAEDDFNRIEANYLTSLGRTAEAEGETAIWADLRQRLYVDPVDLQAKYRQSAPWLQKLVTAWADGLNYYLATHPNVRPKVLTHFEPWMALSFTEGSIGGDIERISLNDLAAFYGKTSVAVAAEEAGPVPREPRGSNGIAIAPKNTVNGHALLLINPHTSFYFRSELQMTSGEGLNAYGASTWGQFFIYQGFNEKAGWMHTSSGVDNVDEFAEDVVRGGASYRYGKAIRAMRSAPVTLEYRKPDGTIGTRTFTTYASHHGPIIAERGGKWIAQGLMWKPIPALEQSWLRTKATDLASYMKVAEGGGVSGASVRIEPGSFVGIAGPSGAGKTTLIDLLIGLTEPQTGTLSVGGMVLDAGGRAGWREGVAYVPQEGFLFHDSVRRNLAWGNRAPDEAAMWEALEFVAAVALVLRMPEGIDTIVGERGALLSGGERQRLALARAILRRPRLLVLDEAMNAIDAGSENLLLGRIAALEPRPTILMISHRAESMATCDQVIRVEGGVVAG